MPIHGVDATDARHLFLVRLFTFLAMSAGWLFLDGSHHRNAFVVFGDNQQFTLLASIHRPLFLAKHRRRRGHLLIGSFQRIHRLRDAQDRFDHVAHPAKRLIDAQELIPLLKQIRHVAGRQLQAADRGRQELEGSAFALGIDPTGNLAFAEHGQESVATWSSLERRSSRSSGA